MESVKKLLQKVKYTDNGERIPLYNQLEQMKLSETRNKCKKAQYYFDGYDITIYSSTDSWSSMIKREYSNEKRKTTIEDPVNEEVWTSEMDGQGALHGTSEITRKGKTILKEKFNNDKLCSSKLYTSKGKLVSSFTPFSDTKMYGLVMGLPLVGALGYTFLRKFKKSP